MSCKVYRCARQDEMYLYLIDEDDPNQLPKELLELVKGLSFVMELELHSDRKLAREDVEQVMKNIEDKGYHLQMPPDPLKTELHYGD